ncbi:MAG TPA: TetR/AcrR family transcriptional regulator [Acidimicrobiales bacterium]|nr:TetR/AcrR family transcriptional regulator [Acidimicrobiales bacterium]
MRPADVPAATPRAATRPLPRAERRRTIIEGAARAFAAGGFDATSMEDIAVAAGVTKLIVYRHFESKEELYRSILESVSERLGALVAEGLGAGRRRGVTVGAFLTVARDDPDGFRLLWQHSRREPRFAGYAEEVRRAAATFAGRSLETHVADPVVLAWAAPMAASFLVEAVLTWLDVGDPGADDRFAAVTTDSLLALFATWSAPRS